MVSLSCAPADRSACPQVVDLPTDLFDEASAARLLLGALPARAGAAPHPRLDPELAAPVAAPLLLPAGAEVGSGLVAEVLGLLASGLADLRVQVCLSCGLGDRVRVRNPLARLMDMWRYGGGQAGGGGAWAIGKYDHRCKVCMFIKCLVDWTLSVECGF